MGFRRIIGRALRKLVCWGNVFLAAASVLARGPLVSSETTNSYARKPSHPSIIKRKIAGRARAINTVPYFCINPVSILWPRSFRSLQIAQIHLLFPVFLYQYITSTASAFAGVTATVRHSLSFPPSFSPKNPSHPGNVVTAYPTPCRE